VRRQRIAGFLVGIDTHTRPGVDDHDDLGSRLDQGAVAGSLSRRLFGSAALAGVAQADDEYVPAVNAHQAGHHFDGKQCAVLAARLRGLGFGVAPS